MTAGTGRPLVVCTLERQEAMRVIADGARARPIAAAAALASGLALLVAGIGWALVAGATA
jgi:F0F1-type ATP synthase membrane subunit c/vacuolar-type H+-ATPase subunit K